MKFFSPSLLSIKHYKNFVTFLQIEQVLQVPDFRPPLINNILVTTLIGDCIEADCYLFIYLFI